VEKFAMDASRRVLVVEDNPDGRQSLQLLLQLWGYTVHVADNGLDGVRAALDWRPDVAILDIGLPGLDGFEVARNLRCNLDSEILLIALTAYTHDRQRALEAGFDYFLGKPADMDELYRMLREQGRPTACL
jgi:DNA-binding response OmpR family regulator